MCIFRPINILLGVVGIGLLGLGAYLFIACLPVHVGIPNTLDLILLCTGVFLAALHFGVLCCESTRCCLCVYQVFTGVLATCELVFTVLFFIPSIRTEIVNGTEVVIANASSGQSVVCNVTGLVDDVSAAGGADTPLYLAAVMLGLIFLQIFLIFVANCHDDAVHTRAVDAQDEEKRQALLQHREEAIEENVGVRQYKKKHQGIFDKYRNRKGGKKSAKQGANTARNSRDLPSAV